MKINRYFDWYLRLETDSFIIVVNKYTNEYRNIYANEFENPNQFKLIITLLENHYKYEDSNKNDMKPDAYLKFKDTMRMLKQQVENSAGSKALEKLNWSYIEGYIKRQFIEI